MSKSNLRFVAILAAIAALFAGVSWAVNSGPLSEDRQAAEAEEYSTQKAARAAANDIGDIYLALSRYLSGRATLAELTAYARAADVSVELLATYAPAEAEQVREHVLRSMNYVSVSNWTGAEAEVLKAKSILEQLAGVSSTTIA